MKVQLKHSYAIRQEGGLQGVYLLLSAVNLFSPSFLAVSQRLFLFFSFSQNDTQQSKKRNKEKGKQKGKTIKTIMQILISSYAEYRLSVARIQLPCAHWCI